MWWDIRDATGIWLERAPDAARSSSEQMRLIAQSGGGTGARELATGAVPPQRRCTELAGGAVASGEKRATMIVRRWPENVRVELADAGVRLLVGTMYGGRRERIVLPLAVAAVAFGGG
jgi:hypothetical protein